jgi:hypothetical protein
MKCIVLQDTDGAHLGFMLCSHDLSEESGDCVFMPFPGQANLFDSPGANLISQRRDAGESNWQVSERDPFSVVVRTPGLEPDMFIEFSGSGPGHWGIGSGADRKSVGRALLPQSG